MIDEGRDTQGHSSTQRDPVSKDKANTTTITIKINKTNKTFNQASKNPK